ncbi:MAG TPA: alpha/beta hydrolase [Solirubrobacteraceae bacterium]|nr:alpha/beta hydrolase [Solirubrobacteraceae bacterium]
MSRLAVEGPKTIYYERHGGSGRTIVLVHGWGMSCRVWDLTLPALLEAGHDVVSFDQRCCGSSDKDFDDTSPAAAANDVLALIEETGVSDPVVVGWSFGAAVVAQAAIDGGSRFGAMVLVGPPTPRYLQADGFPHGGTQEIMDQTLQTLRDNRPEFLHGLAQAVCHAEVGAPTEQWMWQIFMQASPRADAGLGELGQIDHRDALPSVEIPTLVCSGDHDVIVDPAVAARCAELLPNARLLRFADSGHAPFIEERERFNAALLSFAADPAAAPSPA